MLVDGKPHLAVYVLPTWRSIISSSPLFFLDTESPSLPTRWYRTQSP
jgi:hypothetical protein